MQEEGKKESRRIIIEQNDPFIVPSEQIKEVVDKQHLIKLPDDQHEAFEKAQQIKEMMYEEHIKLIVTVQRDLETQNEALEQVLLK